MFSMLGININIFYWFTLLADYITYNILNMDKNTHLAKALHFFIEDTTKIFFLLSMMIIIVSFFRSKLKPEKVRKYIEGRPKIYAYLLAVLFWFHYSILFLFFHSFIH